MVGGGRGTADAHDAQPVGKFGVPGVRMMLRCAACVAYDPQFVG